MISVKLLVFLSIGTLAMCVPILLQSRWYNIKPWKSIIVAVALTITGTVGTFIMFFVESGSLGGRSFYGAVFFIPIAFRLLAILIRIPYGDLMDLSAPAVCLMLAIMKIQCCVDGCCSGRFLFWTADGTGIFFPSQIAELASALIIFAILLYMSRKGKYRDELYLWYLVIYGVTRFILNFFRLEFVTTEMLVPFGTIWSVCAVIVGSVLLIRRHTHKQ